LGVQDFIFAENFGLFPAYLAIPAVEGILIFVGKKYRSANTHFETFRLQPKRCGLGAHRFMENGSWLVLSPVSRPYDLCPLTPGDWPLGYPIHPWK